MDIGVAISQGKKALKLAEDYRSSIEPRLKPDELAQLGLNLQELERCRPGQQENLVNQKSKTEGQNTSIRSLHRSVTSIRNMVKCDDVTGDILKAYGVGEKIPKTVTGAVAAANMIVNAYNTYTDWSNNEAGIVEEDITG